MSDLGPVPHTVYFSLNTSEGDPLPTIVRSIQGEWGRLHNHTHSAKILLFRMQPIKFTLKRRFCKKKSSYMTNSQVIDNIQVNTGTMMHMHVKNLIVYLLFRNISNSAQCGRFALIL